MRRIEMLTLSPAQARSLLDAARGDRFEALYTLALTTGMREGELLSLRWRSLDLDQGTLQVRTTIRRTTEGFTVTEAKTARSRRKLLLTPNAVDALRRHREAQKKERSHAGEAWEENDLVFPNTIGKPVEAGNFLRRQYRPLLKRLDLPPVRFHDLRHTAATLLLLQGVHPKVVSEMLGHASVSITLDLYSHVLPDMQRDAMEAMARLFAGVTDETVVKTVVKADGEETSEGGSG
jgi:integrase